MRSVIDFHTHILPGIDDGSESLQESVQMLRTEKLQGIDHVVATPHFYANHDNPEHFLRARRQAEMRLREVLDRYDGLPTMSVGAEVHYFRGISDSDILSELTIDKKRCILIEMPLPPWNDQMYRELEAIYERRGFTPIIAHVDRYIAPFRTHRIPERLEQLPVLVQANASFFLHGATKSMALRMLRKNQIHLLGSDCHNMQHRPPNLGEAVKVIERHLDDRAIQSINRCEVDVLGR